MNTQVIEKSSLLLNSDHSIYHLNLHPEDIADTIILVGDRDRVNLVSNHFDLIHVKKANREFVTHTGTYQGMPITVMSTGIGVGNIDIALNELDALANIDLTTQQVKDEKKSLKIIRFGTSGAIHPDINTDSLVISEYAIGFDGVLNFYQRQLSAAEENIHNQTTQLIQQAIDPASIYVTSADSALQQHFSSIGTNGITLTCSGFYGAQYRKLRLPLIQEDFIELTQPLTYNDRKTLNMEMETAMIYGLGKLLGHQCCSINAIINNRISNIVSENPHKTILDMIDISLKHLKTFNDQQ